MRSREGAELPGEAPSTEGASTTTSSSKISTAVEPLRFSSEIRSAEVIEDAAVPEDFR